MLELCLEAKLFKCINLFRYVNVVAVCDIALVCNAGDDTETALETLSKLVGC